jgi:hypothetical protein
VVDYVKDEKLLSGYFEHLQHNKNALKNVGKTKKHL